MKEHNKIVGLLALGTFVEQFDCMLYVHLAVVLNESFFPKTDPHTQKLLGAFAFSMPYVLRPLGALLIGYIGDIKGRKYTIVVTTFIMGISCLVMAFLPTYAQIGMAAAITLIVCRTLQSFAALGEMIGAQIYLTEKFTPPVQYLMVLLIGCAADIGGICAIGGAHLTILYGFNWRIVFLLGAGIAILSSLLRSKLSDTSSWLKPIKNKLPQQANSLDLRDSYPLPTFKTAMAYCCLLFLWPVGFYFIYIYCSELLKCNFSYHINQVIAHNLLFSIASPLVMCLIGWLTLRVHPFKIMKVRLFIFGLFIIVLPTILDMIKTPFQLLILQVLAVILWPSMRPGEPIFFTYFNKIQRFRYVSILFSVAKTTIHIVTSIGFVLVINQFNNWGILVLLVPIVISYAMGLNYFQNLENKK